MVTSARRGARRCTSSACSGRPSLRRSTPPSLVRAAYGGWRVPSFARTRRRRSRRARMLSLDRASGVFVGTRAACTPKRAPRRVEGALSSGGASHARGAPLRPLSPAALRADRPAPFPAWCRRVANSVSMAPRSDPRGRGRFVGLAAVVELEFPVGARDVNARRHGGSSLRLTSQRRRRPRAAVSTVAPRRHPSPAPRRHGRLETVSPPNAKLLLLARAHFYRARPRARRPRAPTRRSSMARAFRRRRPRRRRCPARSPACGRDVLVDPRRRASRPIARRGRTNAAAAHSAAAQPTASPDRHRSRAVRR